jgi:hypothetical protein
VGSGLVKKCFSFPSNGRLVKTLYMRFVLKLKKYIYTLPGIKMKQGIEEGNISS